MFKRLKSSDQSIARFVASAASAAGAAHRRSGMPNQDAAYWTSGVSGTSVLALADGHGAAAHPKSEVGARLAAVAGVEVYSRAIAERALHDKRPFGQVLDLVREGLPSQVVEMWNASVDKHSLQVESQTETKHADLSRLAYGSTVTVCAVTTSFCVLGRIGDGDVLIVDDRGVCHWPFGKSDTQVGEETDSLCMETALDDFQASLWLPSSGKLQLLLATTDGFLKHIERKDIERFALGLADEVRTSGPSVIAERLPEVVEHFTAPADASCAAIPDDTTIGVVVPVPPAERPRGLLKKIGHWWRKRRHNAPPTCRKGIASSVEVESRL